MPIVGRLTDTAPLTRRRRSRRLLRGIPEWTIPHSPLYIRYSLSNTRSNPLVLEAATVSGSIYIYLDNNEADIVRVQFFMDPADSGNLPPQEFEGDDESYVRGDVVVPYDLKGGTGHANPWDTTTDPTGNNRSTFLTDGSHTLAVRVVYIDTSSDIYTATFTVNNGALPPTPPSAPTGLVATTPIDNQIVLNWNDNSELDLDGYEYRISTDDPPASPPIRITPSMVTVSNLASGVTQYAQVRAVNLSGSRSSWSAVVSATPSGDPTPPPPNPGRIDGGTGRLRSHATTGGPPISGVPQPWAKADISPGASATRVHNTIVNLIKEAYDKWNNAWYTPTGWRDSSNRHTIGPRATVTFPLSWSNTNAKSTSGVLTNSNNYKSYIDMKKVADGLYEPRYSDAAKTIFNSTYGGFTDWEKRIIIRLGHEHNLPAFPWYSGVDADLIGTIPTALDPDGIGDRGPTYAAAFRSAASNFRTISNDFIFDLNYAHPGADATDPSDGLPRTWNTTAWPGDDWVDCIGLDIYCRSSGVSYGSGSNLETYLLAHQALGTAHNRPLSFPEVGIARHNNGTTGFTSPGATTDIQASNWMSYVFGWIDAQNLAYWLWWASDKYTQGTNGGANDGYNYRLGSSGIRSIAPNTLPKSGRTYLDASPLSWDVLQDTFA